MARAAPRRSRDDRRHAFATLARAEKVPHLERVVVTAMPVLATWRSRPDTGACFPAVKAAVDGLVDAGVLVDDTPDRVLELRFTAPAIGKADALVIVVQEVPVTWDAVHETSTSLGLRDGSQLGLAARK